MPQATWEPPLHGRGSIQSISRWCAWPLYHAVVFYDGPRWSLTPIVCGTIQQDSPQFELGRSPTPRLGQSLHAAFCCHLELNDLHNGTYCTHFVVGNAPTAPARLCLILLQFAHVLWYCGARTATLYQLAASSQPVLVASVTTLEVSIACLWHQCTL